MSDPLIAGVSTILRFRDLIVFELQKRHKWLTDVTGQTWIGLGCIGGSIETGEDPLQALQREAQEEIGTSIEVIPAGVPLLMEPDNNLGEPIKGCFFDGAFLQWYGDQPEYADRVIVSYLGRVAVEPAPRDLPGIVLAQPRALREALSRSLTLGQMEQAGINIMNREPLPRGAKLLPQGTAKRLFHLMGHEKELLIARLPQDWRPLFN